MIKKMIQEEIWRFYIISHGTVCLQDYFMEQIDSILKSYGYQNLNYGNYGISAESTLSSQ